MGSETISEPGAITVQLLDTVVEDLALQSLLHDTKYPWCGARMAGSRPGKGVGRERRRRSGLSDPIHGSACSSLVCIK